MSRMERRDAVIVGGGPAGSTLARALAQAGASVAVLDKQAFPRDKTCAGWITPAVVAGLGLDLGEYRRSGRVLQAIHGFRVGRMGRTPVYNDHGLEPVSYGIRRCEFDHFLLGRSGAELRAATQVTSLSRDGGEWIVNGSLRTPLLVGAGGHFCPVARALGAELGRTETVVGAQEFEVELSPAQLERTPVRGETPQLYFCPDLAGYAWVMRKGRWLNVGIGRIGPRHLTEHFERFLGQMVRAGVLDEAVARSRPHGHAYLLYPLSARTLVDEGALLIGDAAGLAYPESGEGIRPAIESALLAARTIVDSGGNYSRERLEAYSNAIGDRYGTKVGLAGKAARPAGALEQWVAALLMRTSWFTREVVTRRWFLHEHVAPLRG